MASGISSRRLSTAIRLFVLGAAAVLAVWAPVEMLRGGGWQAEGSVAGWADASLADVRRSLAPGERVGVLVPPLDSSSEETAFWYSAQYALVPAVVEQVLMRDCLGAAVAKCRLERSNRVVALFPRREWIGFAERRLGLEAVGTSGGVLLMRTQGAK